MYIFTLIFIVRCLYVSGNARFLYTRTRSPTHVYRKLQHVIQSRRHGCVVMLLQAPCVEDTLRACARFYALHTCENEYRHTDTPVQTDLRACAPLHVKQFSLYNFLVKSQKKTILSETNAGLGSVFLCLKFYLTFQFAADVLLKLLVVFFVKLVCV